MNKRFSLLAASLCCSAAVILISGLCNTALGQDVMQPGTEKIKPPTMRMAKKHPKPKPKMAACDTPDATMAGPEQAEMEKPLDPGQSADLSGTYMGMIEYPDGGMTGNATLTIEGSKFTLAQEGGSSVTGRVFAVQTKGYIGVTMRVGEAKSDTEPAPTLSLRFKKMGQDVSLMSVEGEMHSFSFMTMHKMMKGKKKMCCGKM